MHAASTILDSLALDIVLDFRLVDERFGADGEGIACCIAVYNESVKRTLTLLPWTLIKSKPNEKDIRYPPEMTRIIDADLVLESKHAALEMGCIFEGPFLPGTFWIESPVSSVQFVVVSAILKDGIEM